MAFIYGGLGEVVITLVCGTRVTSSILVGHPNKKDREV